MPTQYIIRLLYVTLYTNIYYYINIDYYSYTYTYGNIITMLKKISKFEKKIEKKFRGKKIFRGKFLKFFQKLLSYPFQAILNIFSQNFFLKFFEIN